MKLNAKLKTKAAVKSPESEHSRMTYDGNSSNKADMYYADSAQSSYGNAHIQTNFSEEQLEVNKGGPYNDYNVNSNWYDSIHSNKTGKNRPRNCNLPFEGLNRNSSPPFNQSTSHMFSWLQHCNQQSVVPQTSPNTILPQTSQDTFQNEIEKSTKYAEHQPSSTNHFELQADYVQNYLLMIAGIWF